MGSHNRSWCNNFFLCYPLILTFCEIIFLQAKIILVTSFIERMKLQNSTYYNEDCSLILFLSSGYRIIRFNLRNLIEIVDCVSLFCTTVRRVESITFIHCTLNYACPCRKKPTPLPWKPYPNESSFHHPESWVIANSTLNKNIFSRIA